MELTTTVLRAGWRTPLRAAHGGGDAEGRPLALVRIEAPDGYVGHGEAAPLQSYDGVSIELVLEALDAYAPLLAAAGTIEPTAHPAVLEACRQRADVHQALAAVDLALWDLAGRRADKPVWWLLGSLEDSRADASAVALNAVIGAEDPVVAADEAAAAVRAGFATVKVKVGAGDDLERLRAVRAAVGPDVAIRIDANGAWRSPREAVTALATLAEVGLALCEEPVHSAVALAAVSAESSVPIAVDESLADPGVSESRVVDLVCLKIAGCGGISGVLADAAAFRDLGYDVLIASTLDGPLGIAAALHVAAAIEPERSCGLATLDRFSTPVPPELLPAAGRLAPPPGPGLGDGLLDWYAAL